MVPRQDVFYSINMSLGQYSTLEPHEVEQFIQRGYLKLSKCFSRKQADEVCANIWTRMGMIENDMSTWHPDWLALPGQRDFKVHDFAPRAWGAICDLLGGEERIAEWNDSWDDSLIVNVGKPEGAGMDVGPREVYGWHVDGDNFVHYLDSPEQALLVVPLWTDVVKHGGGTLVCPDAIPMLVLHLYDHPEGVMPDMSPRGDGPSDHVYSDIAQMMPDGSFFELTGEVGDVYLLHPLMLHSVSNNKLRRLRIISNPGMQLREPFNFARPDPSEYSIVERATLHALGRQENLKSWSITGPREHIEVEREQELPEEVKEQQRTILPPLQQQHENALDSVRLYQYETPRESGVSFLRGVLNPF